jgi:serine/threonine protein kinase
MPFRSGSDEPMEVFELLSRYEGVCSIGQGTYGIVCSARDSELVAAFQAHPPLEYADPSLTAEEKKGLYDACTLVAIKKLRQLFESNRPRMWLCATREIQLMMSFQHENVMSATDFFIPIGGAEAMTYESVSRLRASFDSVYVVMKKMDYTLREVLDTALVYSSRSSSPEALSVDDATSQEEARATMHAPDSSFVPLSVSSSAKLDLPKDSVDSAGTETSRSPQRCSRTNLVLHPLEKDYRQFVLYQIFRGVGYLHRCRVIHRDLKPENIMLDCSYRTCVTDFGQGRDVGAASDYSETVLDNSTQWYAAPETLTLAGSLSMGFIDHESFHSADVWSIGCIAAEMLIGRPLFCTASPGGRQQLDTIVRVIGLPSETDAEAIVDYRDEKSKELVRAVLEHEKRRQKDAVNVLHELLASPYHDETAEEVELISRCLAWNPHERINIQTALESPFFVRDGYEPVIGGEEAEQTVSFVKQKDISEPVAGRAFLWDLYVQRHPEVGELCNALAFKHESDHMTLGDTASL